VDCGQGLRWWLIGVGLTATPEHGSSPAGTQQREGDSGLTVVRVAMSRPGDDGEETAEEVLGVGSA
jgi:hypothetical protein